MIFWREKQAGAILFAFFVFAVALFFPMAIQARVDDCTTNQFSDGTTSKELVFPPGGGTNMTSSVSLPIGATLSECKVDLTPQNLIKTPYIWIPHTSAAEVIQLRTKDGSEVARYPTVSNPSRVTVMPGGDTWVASRTSSGVTQLSPIGGASELYTVTGTYSTSGQAKGITFDNKGNIWVGDYNSSSVWKFANPGFASTSITNPTAYPYVYGAIGDAYGYVSFIGDSGGGNRRVVMLNTKSSSFSVSQPCTFSGSNYIYGIGMDNEGNIVAASYGGGGYCKFGGAKSGPNFGKVIQQIVSPQGSRGIAVDGSNNVWMTNSVNNHIYVFDSSGNLLKDMVPGSDFGNYSDMLGVAIDFDNNAWVVSNGSGHVLKIGGVGTADAFSVLKDVSIGGSLYNYSDMTGFRSTPTVMNVGTNEFYPTTGSNTYTGFCGAVQAALGNCSCVNSNGDELCSVDPTNELNCVVPLSLFSVTGGDYLAQNLKIGCKKIYAPVIGGLVPCGRIDDNPGTSWDDTAPCDTCFVFQLIYNIISYIARISFAVAVFMIVIAGLMYAISVGNVERTQKAKSIILMALRGLVIIFVAWVLVAVILALLGYIHPLSGDWRAVDCALPASSATPAPTP